MANDTENYRGHEIKVKQVDGKISPLWYAWVDGSKIKASQCTAEDALKYAKASIDSHEARKLDKALGTQEEIDDLLKDF
jgi:hypothetical protein